MHMCMCMYRYEFIIRDVQTTESHKTPVLVPRTVPVNAMDRKMADDAIIGHGQPGVWVDSPLDCYYLV